MLTSDFGNYSESDSIVTNSTENFNLNSESSDYPGSEIDYLDNNSSRKHKSKSRPRSQKKVKYWTLPTMSNGTFNPSMLTARQQLQYLAQKSKLGEESDSLELSPLRLDRIKFEEMKSLTGNSSKEHDHSSNSSTSPKAVNTSNGITSSPLNKSGASKVAVARGSKLKEEISSSPTMKSKEPSKVKKADRSAKEQKNAKKIKPDATVVNRFEVTVETAAPVVVASNNDQVINEKSDKITEHIINHHNTNDFIRDNTAIPNSTCNSFFGNVKNFLFDYKAHHGKHFENFLKDFAKRLGLSPEDEIIKKKREEIMKKGMI